MALYLNNLDLNGNQLQKAVVHPLGTAPSSAQEGQIYYDTGDNVIYVNTSTTVNSPNWVNMQSGDLTGITITTDSGSGSAASDTSGNADFSLLGTSGVGVTNSGATITVTSVPSEIDHDSLLNFASNEHFTQANITTVGTIGTGVWQGTAIATAYIADDAVTYAKMQNVSATNKILGRITSGSGNVEELTGSNVISIIGLGNVENKSSSTIRGEIVSGDIPNNAADTTGNAATATTAGTVTTAAQTNITSLGTLTGLTVSGNITANGNINGDNATNIGAIDTITAKEIALNTHGSNTTLKILDVASKSITLGKTNTSGNTDGTSVSVENDLTVKGKLTVQGDLVTTSTSNTVIKDNIIQINDGGNASNHTTTQADMGIVMDRGTDGNVALNWDESDNAFKFIATGDTAASSTMTMTPGGGDNNDENTSGTTAPAGYQTLYAGIIRAVGAVGTAGFYGDGANITGINGSNISSGTIAAARVATLNQSTTGNAATATKISSITNSNIVQLTTTQTLSGKTLTSPVLNTGVSGTAIKDEDNMTSNSDTHLATQQSIKAYVDSQTSSSGNTGGRQAFVLAAATSGVAATSSTVFTITHGMGSSRNYGVEVIRNGNNSGGGETVIVDVARPTDTTITVTFATAPTAGDYTALVCKY